MLPPESPHFCGLCTVSAGLNALRLTPLEVHDPQGTRGRSRRAGQRGQWVSENFCSGPKTLTLRRIFRLEFTAEFAGEGFAVDDWSKFVRVPLPWVRWVCAVDDTGE